mgnify:CR=1 FL=1
MRRSSLALPLSLSRGAVAALCPASVGAALLLHGCGSADPADIAIVVQVQSLTSTASKLVVGATLDSKQALQTQDVVGDLSRFGVRLPLTTTGSLALSVNAYDSAQCKVAQGSVSVTLGAPYQFQVTVPMQTLSTRECPPPSDPPTCTAGSFCWVNPLPQGNAYLGVWSNSASDGWAVGPLGTIARYNGTSWSLIKSGVTSTLRSVWAASPTDAWAVGDDGTILHYNAAPKIFRRCLALIGGRGSDCGSIRQPIGGCAA